MTAKIRQFGLALSLIFALFTSSTATLACACLVAPKAETEHSCCPPVNENHCPPPQNSENHHAQRQFLIHAKVEKVSLAPCDCCVNSAPPSGANETKNTFSHSDFAVLGTSAIDFAPLSRIESVAYFYRNSAVFTELFNFPKSSRAPPVLSIKIQNSF